MADDKDILKKLSKQQQEAVQASLPTTKQGKKELDDLLHFGPLSHGKTTEDSRLEVRAILLAAVNSGMPMEQAKALKETLRTSPPQKTKDLLADINNDEMTPKTALSKFALEGQTGVKLTSIDPTTELPDVTVKPSTTVNVSPETKQNLDVAHSINFAVKSIVTDGAPNQAPDLYRTDGRNFLLYDNSVNPGSKLTAPLGNDKQYKADMKRAHEIDKDRGTLEKGEDYGNIVTMSQQTAALGTGKCGEHAATSFALLTDPKTLEKLGVEIPEGSTIILALGGDIDHNYVLIAEPGSIEIVEDPTSKGLVKPRIVNVKDANKVVVVDPWMPVPTAHTLSRRNAEIQVDPICKMAVVMKKGQPLLLERDGKETPIKPGETAVIDQLNNIKEKIRPTVLKTAEKENVVPKNKPESLALGCGRVQQGVLFFGKPSSYAKTHLSTDTPQDKYQCVDGKGTKIGKPTNYFVGDQNYIKNEHTFIRQAKNTSVEDMAFDPGNQLLMPKDLAANLKLGRDERERIKNKPLDTKPKVEEPEVDQPKVEKPKQQQPKLREELGIKKQPEVEVDKSKVEVEKPKNDVQQKVDSGKPGKLSSDPRMKEIMSRFEKAEIGTQPNVKQKQNVKVKTNGP